MTGLFGRQRDSEVERERDSRRLVTKKRLCVSSLLIGKGSRTAVFFSRFLLHMQMQDPSEGIYEHGRWMSTLFSDGA